MFPVHILLNFIFQKILNIKITYLWNITKINHWIPLEIIFFQLSV